MRIRWQMRVKNERVLELAEAERASVIVNWKRWNWIGHVLRKGEANDCAVALGWTPDGKRARGRETEDNMEKDGGKGKKHSRMDGAPGNMLGQLPKTGGNGKKTSRTYAPPTLLSNSDCARILDNVLLLLPFQMSR